MIQHIILTTLIVFTAFLVGCKNKSHDGHGHESHGGETEETEHKELELSLTKVQDGIEWFVVFAPAVVGETTKFTIHATDLSRYKPAPIKWVQMKISNNPEGESKNAQQEGIHGISIPFANKGLYSMQLIYEQAGKKQIVAMGKIEIYADDAAIHTLHEEPNPEQITFTKINMWDSDFRLETVQKKNFDMVVPATGELLPALNNEIGIIASTSGIIKLAKNLLPGKQLADGAHIGTISGHILDNNISTQYRTAAAEMEKAEKHYNRSLQLKDKQLITLAEFDQSVANFKTAQAEFSAIAENYSPEGKQIVAPSAGTVAKILVGEGDYVTAGQMIAKIHMETSFMLRADVPKFYADRISEISDANFIPEYSHATFSVRALGGSRIQTELVTDDRSAYIPVFFQLPSHKSLIAHSYAEIFLTAPTLEKFISVDNTAIMENETINWVYVQVSGEAFMKRTVSLGATDGHRTVILSGLQAGETVVTQGAYRVKLSSMSSEVPQHMH